MNCLSELMEAGMKVMAERGMIQTQTVTIHKDTACWLGCIYLGIYPYATDTDTADAIQAITETCPVISQNHEPILSSQTEGVLWSLMIEANDSYHWGFEQGLAWLKEHNL